MNDKRYKYLQSKVTIDEQIKDFRISFKKIKDHRASNQRYPLHELLMSIFAMFSLKYVSLLDFETQTESERSNLKTIFGVKKLSSDSGLRKVLDKVTWKQLRTLFKQQFTKLDRLGILRSYEYLQGYILVSVDGVEHFNSKNIHCEHCLSKNPKNGEVLYAHSMLCAVVVHPDEAEVFVIGTEPIQTQDGQQKNDCERNASKRLKIGFQLLIKVKSFYFWKMLFTLLLQILDKLRTIIGILSFLPNPKATNIYSNYGRPESD